MAQVFITHAEEDADLVFSLADRLEAEGYTTWCYKRNSIPGVPHLDQTLKAIEQAQAVIFFISLQACESTQIDAEVVKAHELKKPIVPLLRNITYDKFKQLQPRWDYILRAAVAIPITRDTVSVSLPRIVKGLRLLGVKPDQTRSTLLKQKPDTREGIERAEIREPLKDIITRPGSWISKRRINKILSYITLFAVSAVVSGIITSFILNKYYPPLKLTIVQPKNREEIPHQPVVSGSLGNEPQPPLVGKDTTLGETMQQADSLLKDYARQKIAKDQVDTLISILDYRALTITDGLRRHRSNPKVVEFLDKFERLHASHKTAIASENLILAHEILADINQLLADASKLLEELGDTRASDKQWFRYWLVPESVQSKPPEGKYNVDK